MPCVSGAHAQQTLCTPGKQTQGHSAVLHLQVAPSEQAHPPWMGRWMIVQSIGRRNGVRLILCDTLAFALPAQDEQFDCLMKAVFGDVAAYEAQVSPDSTMLLRCY